jgi:hypothetical protein
MAEMSGLRRRLRSERGAELIETALTLPLILLVVIGIIEFGFVFQKLEIVTNAAREGARVLVLPDFGPADAIARMEQYLDAAGLDPDLATLPEEADLAAVEEDLDGTNCIAVVNVWVTYPHQAPFLAGIGRYFNSTFGTFTLRGRSTMRTEDAGVECSP